jgi:hypothetical protein
MLKYPIRFAYNDAVSVILLRWNTGSIEYFNLNNIYLENKTHGTDTESLYTKPIEYFNM